MVLKQLGVWFGMPITAAIVVAMIVIGYFLQSVSAEISAYICLLYTSAREFADIPLVGRTIFEQQQLLYRALMEWLDHFEGQFLKE